MAHMLSLLLATVNIYTILPNQWLPKTWGLTPFRRLTSTAPRCTSISTAGAWPDAAMLCRGCHMACSSKTEQRVKRTP